jgi:hypothetical protein
MRKPLWVIPFLFATIGAPSAHAQESCSDLSSLGVQTDLCIGGTYPITLTSGGPALIGSYVFDITDYQFVSLINIWDGITFDLTSSANNPNVSGVLPSDCTGTDLAINYIAGQYSVEQNSLITTTCDSALNNQQRTHDPDAMATDTWVIDYDLSVTVSITDSVSIPSPIGDSFIGYVGDNPVSSSPEPATVGLMLTGIGLALVMRKRITRTAC